MSIFQIFKSAIMVVFCFAMTCFPIALYGQEIELAYPQTPSLLDHETPYSSELVFPDLVKKLSPLPGFERILDPYLQRMVLPQIRSSDCLPYNLLKSLYQNTQHSDLFALDDPPINPRSNSDTSIPYDPGLGGSLALQGSTNTKKYRIILYEDSYNGAGAGESLWIEAIFNVDDGEYYFRFTKMGDPDRHVPWNNMLSSIKSGAEWWLYDDEDCSDLLTNGEGDTKYVGDTYNDKTSSAKFCCQDTYDVGWFWMYEDSQHDGELLPLDFWRYGDGHSEGRVIQCKDFDHHWNDRISYIKVNSEKNQTWYFYEHKNHEGTEIHVNSGGEKDLGGQYMNDRISAFKLRIQ